MVLLSLHADFDHRRKKEGEVYGWEGSFPSNVALDLNPRGSLILLHRGYYTVARRCFWVAKQYFTNKRSEWVKYCFCHEKIKFISSSRRVMFFLLYRQKDIDKIMEGNYRNYVIDKLTCEIMENKPLGSRV